MEKKKDCILLTDLFQNGYSSAVKMEMTGSSKALISTDQMARF